ncbi:MAG: ORF6N domain-containing protein [Nitrospira defluvii]|nr:ORF6N domain-containing protein [Nitrospira defluvii]
MSLRKTALVQESLEPLILVIRNQRVILDADLARLYGVPTYRFNEAFKRNRRRFPKDFAFQLTAKEFADLRSHSVTSNMEGIVDSTDTGNSSQFAMSSSPESKALNRSQFVTSSSRHRGKAYRPWAFTEHGAVMAANILRSDRAIQMSVFVVRAFVRLREHIAANQAILKRLAEIDRSLLQHDSALLDLYEKLLPLLQPLPDPPKRRIGFQSKGKL